MSRLIYRFEPDWHTPAWYQPWRSIGGKDYPVGCGPAAWTILYAYWKQFKGKSNLFQSDLSGRCFNQAGEPNDVMWRIADLTGTTYGDVGEPYGFTRPSRMGDGICYAKEKGYSDASVVRYRSGEREKWRKIDREIQADRPVILTINVRGNTNFGFPDHYVVVERTLHMPRPGVDTYGYFVNMAHGSNPTDGYPHKWIFTVQKGVDDSAFSAYLVRMTDEAGPRPFEIVVENSAGRDTVCADSSGNKEITFHLANLKRDCERASVQIIIGDVLVRTLNLEEGEDASFTVSRHEDRVQLKASCGVQRAEKTIYLDYEPPTFNRITVTPITDLERSVVLVAEGLHDDGYWNNIDYEVSGSLDGVTVPPRSGTTLRLTNLSPGTHSATMQIRDRCGRLSTAHSVTFVIAERAPSVTFVRPVMDARVMRGSDMTISVDASSVSGIMRLSIYLDRVSEDEFYPTKLCVFPGIFGEDRPARKTCTVKADWTRGRHTLIAVARDNSGQTTTVERTIQVE